MKCIYIRQYQTNFELPKKAQSPPGSIVTININYTVQKQTFILLKSSGGPMTCQTFCRFLPLPIQSEKIFSNPAIPWAKRPNHFALLAERERTPPTIPPTKGG